MIGRFLIKIVASALALLAADLLLSGFAVMGGVGAYGVAALALAVLNTFVRPIIRLLSLPFVWLTLGLFLIVVNGYILWLAAILVDAIVIDGILSLLYATLIVSVVLAIVDRPSDND